MNADALKDIHGPVAVPGEWWWVWLLLVLLLVAGAAWWWFLLRQKPRLPEVVVPSVPPWEKAMAALLVLEGTLPKSSEEVKRFYFSLSGIVRLYIEERFNIRAPEMTTEEFMDRVRFSMELSAQDRVFLDNFLTVSDMVKFARLEPLASDMLEAMRSARGFVEGTKPVPFASSQAGVKVGQV